MEKYPLAHSSQEELPGLWEYVPAWQKAHRVAAGRSEKDPGEQNSQLEVPTFNANRPVSQSTHRLLPDSFAYFPNVQATHDVIEPLVEKVPGEH